MANHGRSCTGSLSIHHRVDLRWDDQAVEGGMTSVRNVLQVILEHRDAAHPRRSLHGRIGRDDQITHVSFSTSNGLFRAPGDYAKTHMPWGPLSQGQKKITLLKLQPGKAAPRVQDILGESRLDAITYGTFSARMCEVNSNICPRWTLPDAPETAPLPRFASVVVTIGFREEVDPITIPVESADLPSTIAGVSVKRARVVGAEATVSREVSMV